MRSQWKSRSRLVLTGIAVVASVGLLAGCTGSGGDTRGGNETNR